MVPADRSSRRGPTQVKRRAILDAALMVFAARGFARSSVEAVAEQAGVSNRTIYNHFRDKAQLFQVVIESSAAVVADAQLAVLERHMAVLPAGPAEMEDILVGFAIEWTTPLPGYETHRALVEQVRAEVGHVPDAAIDAWQRAGPQRVRAGLGEAFRRFAEAGLLRTADPAVAAADFTRLVTLVDPLRPHSTLTGKRAADSIADAVNTFLYGYAADAPAAGAAVPTADPDGTARHHAARNSAARNPSGT